MCLYHARRAYGARVQPENSALAPGSGLYQNRQYVVHQSGNWREYIDMAWVADGILVEPLHQVDPMEGLED